MPIVRAPHVTRPYAGDGLVRLADLGMQQARSRANRELQRGERSAQSWGMAGNAIAQGIGAVRQERELVPLREAANRKLAYETEQMRRGEQAYQEGQAAKAADTAKAQRLRDLSAEYQGQRVPTDVLVREFGPVDASHIDKAFDELFPKPEKREGFTLTPGGRRYDADGKEIASAPEKPEAPKRNIVTVPGPNGRPVTKTFTEDELAQGVETYRAPTQGREPERPSLWVQKDGEQRYVTPTQAAQMATEGWRSGAGREQGRPVTSGDAGRIADFDTSLDDLGVLTSTVTGSTGTSAKVGAMLPNWVTELTGRGVSAKQKQAAIDRVKQVIGKALEGGVLRKEDEKKYEKILPTIYDAPAVVTSKLEGLREALTQRRATFVEALTDAGYDTGKFNERTAAPVTKKNPFRD